MTSFVLTFILTTTHFGIHKTEKWNLPYKLNSLIECTETAEAFHKVAPKETFITECKPTN